MGDLWGSDTPISMPEPLDPAQPILADLSGGFGFTSGGIAHDLGESDLEALMHPHFSPEGDL